MVPRACWQESDGRTPHQDCRKTYEELKERGVEFTEAPVQKPFGVQAIFKDLYSNSYALLEPANAPDVDVSSAIANAKLKPSVAVDGSAEHTTHLTSR